MKRFCRYVFLYLFLILPFLIAGCGSSGNDRVSRSQSQSTGEIQNQIKASSLEGNEIKIADYAEDQQNPHVIYLPDKNLWFAVYEDWSNRATTGSDIKGRFIKEDGSLCGDEITITNDTGNQTLPWAAYRDKDSTVSGTGNDIILVVWQDVNGSTTDGYINTIPLK